MLWARKQCLKDAMLLEKVKKYLNKDKNILFYQVRGGGGLNFWCKLIFVKIQRLTCTKTTLAYKMRRRALRSEWVSKKPMYRDTPYLKKLVSLNSLLPFSIKTNLFKGISCTIHRPKYRNKHSNESIFSN